MPIKIHHGPPGSYKTSGAVQEDFIRAVIEGRVCITNVRGLDDEDKIAELLDAPDSFSLINLNTKKDSEKEKLRNFINWAPNGAFFLIDEVNTIWPVTLNKRQMQDVKYSGENPENEEKPDNLVEAFEMHRHFNWDFSFTTPSIKKVNSEILDVAEVAYKHVNKATIGIRGSYWEIMHNADNSGRSKQDQLLFRTRRIKKSTFGLYKSTTTGQVSDTQAGQNIFLQPGPILVLVSLIGAFIYLQNTRELSVFSKDEAVSTSTKSAGKKIQSQNETQEEFPPDFDTLQRKDSTANNGITTSVNTMTRFEKYTNGRKINYHGRINGKPIISMQDNKTVETVSSNVYQILGVEVIHLGHCFAKIKDGLKEIYAGCPPEKLLSKEIDSPAIKLPTIPSL